MSICIAHYAKTIKQRWVVTEVRWISCIDANGPAMSLQRHGWRIRHQRRWVTMLWRHRPRRHTCAQVRLVLIGRQAADTPVTRDDLAGVDAEQDVGCGQRLKLNVHTRHGTLTVTYPACSPRNTHAWFSDKPSLQLSPVTYPTPTINFIKIRPQMFELSCSKTNT